MSIKEEFENYLSKLINSDSEIGKAMNYSLLAESKRVRPLLFLNSLIDLGIDYKKYFSIASAIEMIHTYSLIHDDLPSMDNDDLRRGKPTCHKQFNEAIALLAGDALLTHSFYIANLSNCDDYQKVRIINEISLLAGYKGMCLGQELDINTVHTFSDLCTMEKLKTGCLLGLALKCSAIIAKNEKLYQEFDKIGYELGLAFQIQDDILDATMTQEILGKSISDQANKKETFVSYLGVEKAKELMNAKYKEVIDCLKEYNLNNCVKLVETLVNRSK